MVEVDLMKASTEELIELAMERDLLEGWDRGSEYVCLRVGTIEVAMKEDGARAYLCRLIRSHDLAHSRNGK